MGFWRGFAQPVRYAALAAGALPALAFPAANLEFLGWVGLVPGLALMRMAPTRREAAVRGWWFGTGYLMAAMYWLAPNIGPALVVGGAAMGVMWTGVGVAVWTLLRPPVTARRALAAMAVVPSSWLVTEWIRSWNAIGGPWDVLGASQWRHPMALALAAVGGVWLLSFALVLANTGLLVAVLPRTRLAVRLTGLGLAAAAVAAGPVAFVLTPAAPAARSLTVALVQPGLSPTAKARLQRSEQLTAADAGKAQVYVWGESSVGYTLASSPGLRQSLQRLSAKAGAQILVNQDAQPPGGADSKQATLFSGSGIQGTYVKTRLVPFGEYIPLRSALGWLTSVSRAAAQNTVAGTGAKNLHLTLPGGQGLTAGVLICFESAFPDMSRVDADHGAQVIIYQTSDSTFQQSWAPAQHAALSALRAAETGRPAVQAALTGDSAAFDDRGRELAWEGTSFRGTVLVRLALPPASTRTIYDRIGDVVPWTAVAIAALAGAIGLLSMFARTRRSAAGAPSRPVPGVLSR